MQEEAGLPVPERRATDISLQESMAHRRSAEYLCCLPIRLFAGSMTSGAGRREQTAEDGVQPSSLIFSGRMSGIPP